jgi:hypothetical protein
MRRAVPVAALVAVIVLAFVLDRNLVEPARLTYQDTSDSSSAMWIVVIAWLLTAAAVLGFGWILFAWSGSERVASMIALVVGAILVLLRPLAYSGFSLRGIIGWVYDWESGPLGLVMVVGAFATVMGIVALVGTSPRRRP